MSSQDIVADKYEAHFNRKDRILEVRRGDHVAATYDLSEGRAAEDEADRLNYIAAAADPVVEAHEAHLASLRAALPTAPLYPVPSVAERAHVLGGTLRFSWEGRAAGTAGAEAEKVAQRALRANPFSAEGRCAFAQQTEAQAPLAPVDSEGRALVERAVQR